MICLSESINKTKYEINKSTREKDYLIICSVGYFRINNQIYTSFNMELCFNRYMISTLQNLSEMKFDDRNYDIDFCNCLIQIIRYTNT